MRLSCLFEYIDRTLTHKNVWKFIQKVTGLIGAHIFLSLLFPSVILELFKLFNIIGGVMLLALYNIRYPENVITVMQIFVGFRLQTVWRSIFGEYFDYFHGSFNPAFDFNTSLTYNVRTEIVLRIGCKIILVIWLYLYYKKKQKVKDKKIEYLLQGTAFGHNNHYYSSTKVVD